MLIKQQLQVTNFSGSLGRSQAGNTAIANIEQHTWQGQSEEIVQFLATTSSKIRLRIWTVCDSSFNNHLLQYSTLKYVDSTHNS